MNLISRISAVLLLALASFSAFGQTVTLTQTTLSSAALLTDKTVYLTSATGVSAGTQLYVIAPGVARGEVMLVQSISSTAATVARGRQGNQSAFPSGSRVLIGAPNNFRDYNPSGGCTTATTAVTPWVNTRTGEQFLCSTVTLSWVPGFGTTTAPAGVTAAVASAAGSIIPSGPLFHVTGTSAVTGFTVASMIGFPFSGCFTVVPDAIFTWTSAGNIAVAGTAVVNRQINFCWDQTNSKWVPSYV